MIIRLHVAGRRCYSIKKPLFSVVMILSGIIAGVLIASVIYSLTGFSIFNGVERKNVSVDDTANADVVLLAYSVLEYIRDEDYLALSHIVHPEYGVVLSPYATINLATDRRFSAEQIAVLDSDTNVYVWGVYNGSGEPIELTPAEYFAGFVPAADHIKTAVIGINRIVRSGNALENMTDVFANVKFVDFHVPGGELTEELDWSSLRLGFEEHNGYFRLVAIVYSKWTV